MPPITIISWRSDFIAGLADFLVDDLGRGGGDLSSRLILVPHHRPARYLKRALAAHPALPKPCLLPDVTAMAEFMARLHRELSPAVLRPASRLDQVGLLYAIVESLRERGSGLLARLPLERERFFPWGLRLAALLEELLRQDLTPGNLEHLQDEVEPWAAALLEQLGRIYDAYVRELEERGWTTAGLDARFAAAHLERIEAHLAGRTIVAAGQYAVGGAEEALLKRLWQDGAAHIVWHSDPHLADGGRGHRAVREHRRWLDTWRARAELFGDAGKRPLPDCRFHEGFDRHSQIDALTHELADDAGLENTAVVLPDAGALPPVLHHLPERDVNISMGYPLDRTPLFQLLETVLTLQENRDATGRYLRRDLIALLRHPYLRMLRPDGGQEEGPNGDAADTANEAPLRLVFHFWERHLREGEPTAFAEDFLPPYGEDLLAGVDAESAERLRAEVLAHAVTAFESVTSLAGLARALGGLGALLLRRGGDLWHRYLLDAECLHRTMTGVVPELAASTISEDAYPQSVLFSIFRQLCRGESVSFEPEPITGLQVLGMLETRLLHFRRVLIMDAVEEKLPGVPPHDPLLPDPMRHMLGLPDSRERDNVAAYNFHRLVMGAEEVVLLYQSGVQPGLLDGKSVRSRFVEQLLWRAERERGRLLRPGDAPVLQAVPVRVGPVPTDVRPIPATPAAHRAVLAMLEQGVSASRLNDYLNCPKRFFYRHVARIRPQEALTADLDAAAFGTAMHAALKNFLEPHLGRRLDPETLAPEPLFELLDAEIAAEPALFRAPFDVRTVLHRAGRERLGRFLREMPPTTITELERRMRGETDLALADGTTLRAALLGTMDRVDRRGGTAIILDYKTGSLHKPKRDFWEDMDLWARIGLFAPGPHGTADDAELLADVADGVRDVQLPAYLEIFKLERGERPGDAGWIELADSGKEHLLLDGMDDDQAEAVLDVRIPQLLRFLLGHLAGAASFAPAPGRQCEWCDFRSACGA